MIKKNGSARWSGGLKDGKGHVSTETLVLDDEAYGINTRSRTSAAPIRRS